MSEASPERGPGRNQPNGHTQTWDGLGDRGLVSTSVRHLLAHQVPSGALLASRDFPPYQLLRDGSFVAFAFDLVGSAKRQKTSIAGCRKVSLGTQLRPRTTTRAGTAGCRTTPIPKSSSGTRPTSKQRASPAPRRPLPSSGRTTSCSPVPSKGQFGLGIYSTEYLEHRPVRLEHGWVFLGHRP